MYTTELYGEKTYTAQQSRDIDTAAIEQFGIPGYTLMRRAGQAAFKLLLQHWSYQQSITVLAGSGNNGGDGFVVAALAKQYGIDVRVYFVGDLKRIRGDAHLAYEEAIQSGVKVNPFDPDVHITDGIIVDALLGTGLGGVVRGLYADAIQFINQSGLPVLSLDIPSGLCSDSGIALGDAVRADYTITFIGIKQGLLTAQGPEHVGTLVLYKLELPDDLYATLSASGSVTHPQEINDVLSRRSRGAHKGMYGHVLVVGGDYGMAGAVTMAAEAAARVGAGLVSVATRPEHVSAIVARRPEVMVHGVNSGQDLALLLNKATVIVIGPGLGHGPWAEQMLQQVCLSDTPLVVDADALNMLSEGRVVEPPFRENWVLTPHPGEAARLLGQAVEDIQHHRFASARDLQVRYGGVCVLKGAGSLIADKEQVHMCSAGNPGMASGGMGDVLSGVIGALMAQGVVIDVAARVGVTLHAMAADLAAAGSGERGLLATDLMLPLRRLVNGELG
jgi:NAD(P)H-hydrate epimerase